AGRTRSIINDPQHPYTQGLINALPQQTQPGEQLRQIPGNMPTLSQVPRGCSFHPRCEFATDTCRSQIPQTGQYGEVEVACHEVQRLHFEQPTREEAQA
ncbi:oligopeptide/dipeptide ABC transporter ATP-binding protein, partial [Cognatishimia maritima]